MNAKELVADAIIFIRSAQTEVMFSECSSAGSVLDEALKQIELLVPKYRPPQPSDDGRYCYLEELPSDAPPTLVRYCGKSVVDVVRIDDVTLDYVDRYQYWTVAGWRELTKGVWPCERPEVGGT